MPGNAPQAKTLAEDLMQSSIPEVQLLSVRKYTGALIIAGLTPDVLAALAKYDLPTPPEGLDTSARALAYVVRGDHNRTTLVAMAETVDALEELGRVLPHYKQRSFLVMSEDGVSDKGTWSSPPGPLTIKFK
jgi:hypothetical protein